MTDDLSEDENDMMKVINEYAAMHAIDAAASGGNNKKEKPTAAPIVHNHHEREAKVEKEIDEARSRLTTATLALQRMTVRKMGTALEQIRKDEQRSSICEEIKLRLSEEIKRKLISERSIELYCKDEWKNLVKAEAGRKGARKKNAAPQSAAIIAAQPEPQEAVLITTDGLIEEPAAAADGTDWKPRKAPDPTNQDADKPAIDNQEPRKIEFSFWISLDELHAAMQEQFVKDGASARIRITGLLDVNTGEVVSSWLGR